MSSCFTRGRQLLEKQDISRISKSSFGTYNTAANLEEQRVGDECERELKSSSIAIVRESGMTTFSPLTITLLYICANSIF